MGSVDTFKTWASQITSESEIPDDFRATFRSLRLDLGAFPFVLFCPTFRFDTFETPPRLLVITPQQLICLERRESEVVREELRRDAIHTIEWGSILLECWIRFLGIGPHGPTSIRVDFNACSRELFQPLLDDWRQRGYGNGEEGRREDSASFEALRDVDFKFMSFAQQTLRPGMEVRRHYLQRAVAERILGLPQRLLIAGSMLIATQSELIVIREAEGHAPGEYGGIWSYLRLDQIERLELRPSPDGEAIRLGIHLPGDIELTCDHLPGHEAELRSFIGELRSEASTLRSAESSLQPTVN